MKNCLPLEQKNFLVEKENTTAELDFSVIYIVPPDYGFPLSEGPPKPPVPTLHPATDKPREPFQMSSAINSDALNDGLIQNQDHTASSAKEAALSGNLDPATLTLLSVVPTVRVTGFAVHNWEAIDKGGKELLKNIDKWGSDRWKDLTTW